jgi:hypothetical protein
VPVVVPVLEPPLVLAGPEALAPVVDADELPVVVVPLAADPFGVVAPAEEFGVNIIRSGSRVWLRGTAWVLLARA